MLNGLSRATAERVSLFDNDTAIGKRGFLSYLKSLNGSNVIKVIPDNAANKGLKVLCGSHQSIIPDGAWLKPKTPFSFCQLRVSPSYAVIPNIGNMEFAEALLKVLPFTASDDSRQVLRCVRMIQKDNKLTMIASDGFTLSEINLDFEAGEAEVLISKDDLKALIPAIRKARRVRVSFEEKPDDDKGLISKSLIVDTELIKYSLHSSQGSYPDYDKVFPNEFTASASFDTKEAIRACHSLLSIWYNDNTKGLFRPLILTIGDNKVTVDAKEDRGQAVISAETSGEMKIGVAGNYLIKALRACGGIAEMKLASEKLPITLSVDGYRCLVMPMAIPERKPKAEEAKVAEASNVVEEAEQVAKEAEAKTEVEVKPETKAEAKPKHKDKAKVKADKKRQPVAVA